MDDQEFLARLKVLCEGYDDTNGHYPESEYEGESVFVYAVEWLAEQAEKGKGSVKERAAQRRAGGIEE